MTDDIFFEIHQGLPREGPGRNEYTRKAFEMLPKLDNPRILDIGCGSGLMAEFLKDKVKEIHGVDISGKQIQTCREKTTWRGLSFTTSKSETKRP